MRTKSKTDGACHSRGPGALVMKPDRSKLQHLSFVVMRGTRFVCLSIRESAIVRTTPHCLSHGLRFSHVELEDAWTSHGVPYCLIREQISLVSCVCFVQSFCFPLSHEWSTECIREWSFEVGERGFLMPFLTYPFRLSPCYYREQSPPKLSGSAPGLRVRPHLCSLRESLHGLHRERHDQPGWRCPTR